MFAMPKSPDAGDALSYISRVGKWADGTVVEGSNALIYVEKDQGLLFDHERNCK
jgi:hypothetical protein